jgi:hypothetical protein
VIVEPTERESPREQDPAQTRPFEPLREHEKKADRPAPPQPAQPPPWRAPERPLPPGYAPRPNDVVSPPPATRPSSAPPPGAPPVATPSAPPQSAPPAHSAPPAQSPPRAPDPIARPPVDPVRAPVQHAPASTTPASSPPLPPATHPSSAPLQPARPAAPAPPAARPAPRAEAATTGARPAVQVRRLRKGKLAIRKFDPWAIAKFSVVFYFCMLLIGLFGLGIIFAALKAFGVIGSLEKLLRNLQFDVSISAWTIFRWAFLIGIAFTVIATAITTFMAFLYNLIADVVGGIEMLVTEREQ